jgi:hypothetical protein
MAKNWEERVLLVPISRALDLLSSRAPRAWCARVIGWEVLKGNFVLVSTAGQVVERIRGHQFLDHFDEDSPIWSVYPTDPHAAVDDAVFSILRENFDEETAQVVRKAGYLGLIEIGRYEWSDDTIEVYPGFVSAAAEIDWEAGRLVALFDQRKGERPDDVEWFSPEDPDSEIEFGFHSLCLELESIEMLTAGASYSQDGALSNGRAPSAAEIVRKGGPGRARKHDWDGALLYLVGQAELNSIAPDPDVHGAQASIKQLLADWFAGHGDAIPAESQLESLAKRALQAIRDART